MSKETTRFFLPFAVPAADRDRPFEKRMEMATILCLAESERKKGKGVILKKPKEELVFIAEAYYPMWLVPWMNRGLLFDGLSVITHTFVYDKLPDVKNFADSVKGSTETREAYAAFLSDSLNYFHNFTGKEEKTIEGLVTNDDLIRDFASYLPEAKTVKQPIIDKAILSPSLDETEISSFTQELSNLRVVIMDDITNLDQSMKLLSDTTKSHVKNIREEITETRTKFNEKIEALKPSVMEKVREIQKKYNEKIAELSKEMDSELYRLHSERAKLAQAKERARVNLERCEAGIKSSKLRKDETGAHRWKLEAENCKKERSSLEKSLKALDRRLRNTEAEKQLKISALRSEYNIRAEEAMKGLMDLEASRDAKIGMRQQEIESLEDSTSTVISQIDGLVKLKKAVMNQLDKMGIAKKPKKNTLIYVPFYLACYQVEAKKRYTAYSPSIASSLGILTKLKGVFGIARTKSLLQPRSKPIKNFLNQLLTLLEKNPVFEKEISDAGIQANILKTAETREKIKHGLEDLRDEGWISESELQKFSEMLT